MNIPLWEIFVRLLLATLFGGMVGAERELTGKPAGLRTMILVSLGSALFMIVSILAAPPSFDPMRLAAGVVTGIGFLGAGAIFREGLSVRGITTAATIWVAAALGLSVGSGLYWPALFALALAIVTLVLLHPLEVRLHPATYFARLTVRQPNGGLETLFAYFKEKDIRIEETALQATEGQPEEWRLRLAIPARLPMEELTTAVSRFSSSFSLTIEKIT
jgi:putative Mg2+ transporter-C (MgtC) family protein